MNSNEHLKTDEKVVVIVDGSRTDKSIFYTTKGGAMVGYGQIVALAGDYYKSFDDLDNQTQTDINARFDSLMFRGEGAYDVVHIATSLKYLILASYNATHFINPFVLENGSYIRSPRPEMQKDDNFATWNKGQILAETRANSSSPSGEKLKSYAINAFFNHFLTDAFSAGHMRVPRRCLDGVHFGNFSLEQNVIRALPVPLLIPAGGAPVLHIKDMYDSFVVLEAAAGKLMHDEDGSKGILVTDNKSRNSQDSAWTAFGDNGQARPENARNWNNCLEAVQLSAKRIEQGLHGSISQDLSLITDLIPKPFPPGAQVFSDSKIEDYVVTVTNSHFQEISDAILITSPKFTAGFIMLDWQIRKNLDGSPEKVVSNLKYFSRVKFEGKQVYTIDCRMVNPKSGNSQFQSFPMYFVANNRLMVRLDEDGQNGPNKNKYIAAEHPKNDPLKPPYVYDSANPPPFTVRL